MCLLFQKAPIGSLDIFATVLYYNSITSDIFVLMSLVENFGGKIKCIRNLVWLKLNMI